MPVMAEDVVIDVVAGDGVEALVREIELQGVALPELRVADALCFGVCLAQRLVVGGVLLAPAVETDEMRLRIAFGADDSSVFRRMAQLQSASALWSI